MARATGEMPFLDHLEELRGRIVRSLVAIIASFGLGLWLVNRFQLVVLLKQPIMEYLPGGRLTVLSPTEPLMITLKLGLIVGLVLASPILLWQLWAFLSPALYEKEKKTLVPALFVGLLLFLAGGAAAFVFIVPQALRVLLTFQQGAFITSITFDNYFSFVMQLVLALGLSCELPLLMIILGSLGIVTTPMLNRIRPYAIVGSFVAGAVLSPGADVLSMLMLTIPLLLLFEIGVSAVWVVQKRKQRAAASAALVLLLSLLGRPAASQQPVLPPTRQSPRPTLPGLASDSTQVVSGRRLDSASARRLGLPSAPRLSFAVPDSVLSQLLELEGYSFNRYRADSATVQATDKMVHLRGNAMTDRSGAVLEAASIRYQEGECTVDADGEPHLFQNGQVLIGASAKFDTCLERGVVRDALTNFSEGAGNWFIRGNLAVDSSQSRMYAGDAEMTSCDLPIPHYHFSAKQIKWISKSVMVARPAVLYIRDVPIAWIPFIFQDTKQGRRSGILVPQFGFNDIVRPSTGYNRQVTNIGYYWAPNDYFDAQVQLDWYNNRYLQWGISSQYRSRSRFVSGAVDYQVQNQSGGGNAKSIAWRHTQNFNVSTSLNLDMRYITNSSIISRNSIDPRVTTQQITSQANLTKRFAWGSMTLGGSRRQNISDGTGSMTLPSFNISPKQFDLGTTATWSPSLSFTNEGSFKSPLGSLLLPRGNGMVDTIALLGKSRISNFSLETPLRVGSFNWRNSVRVVDGDSTGRYLATFLAPDLSTPDPNDSVMVTQYRNGGFGTSFDWDTGINLPFLFRSSWKFSPSIGITNTSSGPFAVRNAATGGRFVNQGKRLQFSASVSPTFFGFFPGIGGVARIRHSISPLLSWSYSPAATVPEEYARAVARPGQTVLRTSPKTQTIQLGLSQNFEAKGRAAPGDSTGTTARKFRLLSINTSQIGFDLEQAKLPGRTGWISDVLSNQLASDLIPGFNLTVSHDLWDGEVGRRSAQFKPFLTSIVTGFSITGNTLRSVGALFGLVERQAAGASQPQRGAPTGIGGIPLPGDLRRNTILTPGQSMVRGGQPFQANFTINISRNRPLLDANGVAQQSINTSSVGLNTRFSPTRFWNVTWSTQYNAADDRFEAQQIQLSRDLHEWRAAFNFVKSPNGNFAFFFSVYLTDFADIKFDYNQTTIRP